MMEPTASLRDFFKDRGISEDVIDKLEHEKVCNINMFSLLYLNKTKTDEWICALSRL